MKSGETGERRGGGGEYLRDRATIYAVQSFMRTRNNRGEGEGEIGLEVFHCPHMHEPILPSAILVDVKF